MVGRVITVAGGKGGVGKTTVAMNLAAALADRDRDVALVEADLGMANVAGYLGIDPVRTVHDVLAGEATVPEASVRCSPTLAEHPIDVLAGARDLDAVADADPEDLGSVIDALAEDHDAVVVDTGPGLGNLSVPLRRSDDVVLVTTPAVTAVQGAELVGRVARRSDAPVAGVALLQTATGLDADTVTRRLDTDLLTVVPDAADASRDELEEAYRRLATALLLGGSMADTGFEFGETGNGSEGTAD